MSPGLPWDAPGALSRSQFHRLLALVFRGATGLLWLAAGMPHNSARLASDVPVGAPPLGGLTWLSGISRTVEVGV